MIMQRKRLRKSVFEDLANFDEHLENSFMRFGHFDDKNREYVINTPHTPLPWINYLGQSSFFSLISNTCGGYSFYKDAKLRRITRYRYNDVPRDSNGRLYYIKDGETIWSPGYKPSLTKLDTFECRHGLGYTRFESSKNSLHSSLFCFVPNGDTCEINRLTLKNESDKIKKIDVYGAVEFCLWNAIDDSTNFQRNLNIAEVECEDNTVYHKTEYRERRNHYSFYHVNDNIVGFDTSRDAFVGLENGFDKPDCVINGTSKNSIATSWYPIASLHSKVELKPGESKTFIYILGYGENKVEEKFIAKNVINKASAHELINKYSNEYSVEKAIKDLRSYWDLLLCKFVVSSGNDKFDRMANIWNQYQCMITFCLSRSASYYESGTGRGMGFRDSCQDLLGFVHLIPEKTKERIIDIASIQFEDGSTYHQYQPLTKRGNGDVGSGFNDDPLWLIASTSAYIKESGDSSILDSLVPFNNVTGSEKTLFEHLRRSINYTINHKGPHGLPLIGRADWNDCLNLNCFSKESGESFQTASNFESGKAESVFIAGMFVKYGNEYAELCKRFGDIKEAKHILSEVNIMEKAVIDYGWDGEYFLRAYDAFEHKIGSKDCEEGKIFVEPQGFCVMAKIGKKLHFGKLALASAEKYLANQFGMELLHPCYSTYHLELGEISSYPPGYKENGSVFCHNNPWVVLAHCEEENNEQAFALYKKNSPAFIEDYSEIHHTEPYVYSQTIAGRESSTFGEAKNSWLTGAASWNLVALSQGILGIIPDFDGIKIKPCLPSEMKKVEINRVFRGKHYSIQIENNGGSNISLFLNGVSISGNVVPFVSSLDKNIVKVIIK